MKEYTNKAPVFSDTLPITETTDVAHPDTINPGPIQAFENTLCNRREIEKLNDEKGVAGGVPSLDDNGKVPKEQLPDTTNNLLATEAGIALDAVQGKTLNDKGSQIALYVGHDNCLHFRDWEGNDSIIPIKLVVSNVEQESVNFGGVGTTRTITTGGRLPMLVVQYSNGDYYASSLYYNGSMIRQNNMKSVSSAGITLQSSWDEAHDFYCYIAYEGAEIEVESVNFGGNGTTRTIALKKKPKLIVQVSSVPGIQGTIGVWCNGFIRGSGGSIKSVTDTELTIGSGWNISYTFTCYIVY